MDLRERGIYRLPNGRELVVLGKNENDHVSFRLGGLESFELSQYEVNTDGRVMFQGKLTAWDVGDLKDTGRTADQFAPFASESRVDGGEALDENR